MILPCQLEFSVAWTASPDLHATCLLAAISLTGAQRFLVVKNGTRNTIHVWAMAEKDAVIKYAIRKFLESHNLVVVELPTAPTKTPDLLVNECGQAVALIEIKQKSHDPVELESFLKQTAGGNIASRSRAMGYRNLLDGIIGAGVKQLKTKDATRSLLRVLWIHCEGRDADLHDTRFRATLLGTQKLFSLNHAGLINCYYFWNNSFFKYGRDLDAVVMHQDTGAAQMLLNEFSFQFDRMKNSGVTQAFGSAVWYPAQYGIDNDTMICGFEESRDTADKMLAFLREKYGFEHLQTMDMGLHEAVIGYPKDDDHPAEA